MASSLKLQTDTWFMRLPSGEIEIVEASALERAFHCGLVDSRTPVLAVGSHVWTTLGEAADLDDPPMSIMPEALDEPAADLANGAQWHVRTVEDDTRFRDATKRSRYGVLGLVILAICTAGLGVAWADVDGGTSASTASMKTEARAVEAADPALAKAIRNVRAAEEVPHHSKRDLERLTKEQQRRLRELDLARRMRGDDKRDARRIAAGKPIVVPYENVSADPFGKSVSPFDPLNGSL